MLRSKHMARLPLLLLAAVALVSPATAGVAILPRAAAAPDASASRYVSTAFESSHGKQRKKLLKKNPLCFPRWWWPKKNYNSGGQSQQQLHLPVTTTGQTTAEYITTSSEVSEAQ